MKIIQSVEKRKQKASALINALHLLMTLAIASCAAFTPQAIGFTINTGDILVGNDGNSTVIKIDPNTGQQTLLATFTTVTTNGTQYGGVHDLAFSPNGDLIVLQHEPTVSRVNLVTGAITNISSGGLLGTDAQGTVRFGLIVAPNGDIYVAVYGPNADIVKVDPNTGAQSSVASGGYITGPIGLGFLPSGELMAADNYSGSLIGVNTTTHAQRLVATNLFPSSPWGMTIDVAGNVYLGTDGTNRIQKVSTAGAVSTVVSGGLLNVPRDVALEPSGTLLSFQTVSNAIVRINPTNNTQTIVSSGGLLSLTLSLIVAPFPVTASNAPAQLAIQMYPGISIQGALGGTYNLQFTDSLNNTNWVSLTNIFLSSSPYLFFDTTSTNRALRFYRAVAQ